MLVFIGVNIVVSASVTLLVLNLWDAGRTTAHPVPTAVPTSIAAASGPTAVVATATAVPPTSAPRSYVVEPGDTLSSISRRFEVPLADLLAANNLKDGDLLSIGQTLSIPAGSAPIANATASPTPIRPQANVTQSIALGDAFVTIREIVSSGDLTKEAVVLTNLGGKVNLKGWTLADGEDHKFTFPDITLLPNAELNVHTARGTNTAADLYWGQTATRWAATGTIAYLRDPTAKLIATYRVP